MTEPTRCGECDQPLSPGTTICRSCGWDQTTSLARPPRRSLRATLAGGAWRLLLYGLILALPVVGFLRLRATGPGPDLATTLRWMAFGDGGRARELVTIHRAYEIATAAARFAVKEQQPPTLEGDWAGALTPYATMSVRGWIPLLFWGATTDTAPASVRTFYEIRADDGWGRPYRLAVRSLPRGEPWADDPEVASDLARGLQASLFRTATPDLDNGGEWMRLEVVSAGRDGRFSTADDLALVSYSPVGLTLRLTREPGQVQRQIEDAFVRGRHYFRVAGSRFDLIDARLLAEFRLEYLP
jgi:hypothetical protein